MHSRLLTAAAVLFFGSAFCAFAQQPEDHPQEVKPPAQAEPRHEAEKPPRDQDVKPPHQESRDNKHEQAKPQDHQMKPEQRAGEQPKASRPPGKSAHIPEEKFRANFGREHHFKVSRPVVVEGRPQFVYSGYTLVFVDPWPADWAYSDDCYVEYIDGEYFLFNVLH